MNHRDALLELLIYMVTSASGLENEPHIYGPLRMIEAAQRLCRLLLADAQDDKHLTELISIIEDGKQKSTSDEEGFYKMLQDASAKLVDFI